MIMVGFLLSAVFIVVMLDVRDRVRGAVSERLVASQRMLSALETPAEPQELLEQAATLAEDPTLKSAMDAYVVTASRRETESRELVNTISAKLEDIAARLHLDVIAVADPSGTVVAIAGRRGAGWPRHLNEPSDTGRASAEVVSRRSGMFRVGPLASPRAPQASDVYRSRSRSTATTPASCRCCRALER